MINTQLIEELRTKNGYTMLDLAIKMGYQSKTAYQCKLKASTKWSANDIISICSIFNVEPNQILIIEKVGK